MGQMHRVKKSKSSKRNQIRNRKNRFHLMDWQFMEKSNEEIRMFACRTGVRCWPDRTEPGFGQEFSAIHMEISRKGKLPAAFSHRRIV